MSYWLLFLTLTFADPKPPSLVDLESLKSVNQIPTYSSIEELPEGAVNENTLRLLRSVAKPGTVILLFREGPSVLPTEDFNFWKEHFKKVIVDKNRKFGDIFYSSILNNRNKKFKSIQEDFAESIRVSQQKADIYIRDASLPFDNADPVESSKEFFRLREKLNNAADMAVIDQREEARKLIFEAIYKAPYENLSDKEKHRYINEIDILIEKIHKNPGPKAVDFNLPSFFESIKAKRKNSKVIHTRGSQRITVGLAPTRSQGPKDRLNIVGRALRDKIHMALVQENPRISQLPVRKRWFLTSYPSLLTDLKSIDHIDKRISKSNIDESAMHRLVFSNQSGEEFIGFDFSKKMSVRVHGKDSENTINSLARIYTATTGKTPPTLPKRSGDGKYIAQLAPEEFKKIMSFANWMAGLNKSQLDRKPALERLVDVVRSRNGTLLNSTLSRLGLKFSPSCEYIIRSINADLWKKGFRN